MMLTLEELKNNRKLVNSVDWEMTPEEAVRLYLEWGNNWSREDRYIVRSKSDYSIYFVVNSWHKPCCIYLIKRNSEEAVELSKFDLPERFEKPVCNLKGVFALEGELKKWLKTELNAD
ncbi:MAG: hypothetical protein U9Q38_00085 [Thermodesulfobacteriota bacterium]|nr:hypothetical protein [Thermodesulfobacteriota bacterium]